ncbi:pectin acetylesterase 8-like [Salvia hispanica]|uniref:pectin acetylesterase 8-like n=1 Tax=Salvia hispanica TaxID=49212 RepID=UPI0020096783|nr:pectin acetylesterase 8-like [Salvia hispanica]
MLIDSGPLDLDDLQCGPKYGLQCSIDLVTDMILMNTHNKIKAIPWLGIVFFLFTLIKSQAINNPLLSVAFITDAAAKGARWSGAWCDTVDNCLQRSKDPLGSNINAGPKGFSLPILRANKTINPDFYNWNNVLILYRDGASFMADIDFINPETKLYIRGRRIFTSAIEELMATKGMANAANALLAGDSAGRLATMLNCDRFRSYLPNACRVKCYTDSGFFIRAINLGARATDYSVRIVTLHELADYLPKSCTQRLGAGLCFFPENVVDDIQTPLFVVNFDFDTYQD